MIVIPKLLRRVFTICVLCSLLKLGEGGGGQHNEQSHDIDQFNGEEDTYRRRTLKYSLSICEPRHIHLSVGTTQNSTHSSMIISFSFLPGCDTYFGNTIGAIRMRGIEEMPTLLIIGDADQAQSYNTSYTQHLLKHAKNGETHYYSDIYYHIEVTGLRPGRKYLYQCLLLRHDHLPRQRKQSNLRQFVQQGVNIISHRDSTYEIISKSTYSNCLTPPAPGEWYSPPFDKTIKFAIMGDLGVRPHTRETIKNLDQSHCSNNDNNAPLSDEQNFHCHHSQGVDAILLAGDLAYTNNNHAVWDDWFDMMSEHDFFRTIPMHIALGNHDLDHYDTTEIALAYEKRFRMPQVRPAQRELAPNDLFKHGKDGEHPDGGLWFQAKEFVPYEWGNAYYSYTFGPSKHIILSSYSSFRPGSIQYQWLVTELESIDRSVTPWLIVMLHCPLYNTFKNHQGEIFLDEARVYLEPLFVKHTVNFVISGHLHSYMRTVPTIDAKPNPRGPIHIIQGNGGRQSNEPYCNATTAEEWVRVRDHSMYGYGTLELYNSTHAQWKWVKTGFNAEGEGGSKGRFEPDFDLTDEEWVLNQLFVDDM